MGEQIAIIPARGGSKRIPRKNMKEFCGKPIINYSIEAALTAGIFDEVMVSTDDEEIAEAALKAGAAVPFLRSEKTAGDLASTSDVLLEVLKEYQKKQREFEYICCIYPTAPFVTAERLKEAMDKLKEEQVNEVLPVLRYSYPPQRSRVIVDGMLKQKWPEYGKSRSQDLEPYYHDCGQFYCYRASAYLAGNGSLEDSVAPIIVSELEAQDIDNLTDWRLAEMKYRMLHEEI